MRFELLWGEGVGGAEGEHKGGCYRVGLELCLHLFVAAYESWQLQ